jgi:hypothetical protein
MGVPSRIALVLGGVCVIATAATAAFAGVPARVLPVVPPFSYETSQVTTPKAVQARIRREIEAAMKQLRAATAAPATRSAGCGPGEFANELGPLEPSVQPQVLGRHVQFTYRFAHVPSSLACRPWSLTVVLIGHSTHGPSQWVQEFDVHQTPQGRVVMPLPRVSHPPYTYIVTTETIQGHRAPLLRGKIDCRGLCLPGLTFDGPQPSHPLPVDLERSQVEASLRFVVSRERLWPPRHVGCASRTKCTITYADPLYPKLPFRIGYTVSGERRRGCWMALSTGPRDPLPYRDVKQGESELAGCVSWGTLSN